MKVSVLTSNRRGLMLLSLTLMIAVILVACSAPLEYELTITTHADGSYDMRFDGTVSVLWLTMAFFEATDEDDVMALQQDAEEIVAEISQEPWIESVEHRGNGVIYVRGTESFGPDETGTFLDLPLMSVWREAGTLSFGMSPVTEWDDLYPFVLDLLSLDHDGHIIVRSKTDIIESNGSRGPFGQFWNNALLMNQVVEITVSTP